MSAVIDGPALNHLGAVVHKIRPQWDAPGIRSALERSLAKHGYSDVAIVAVSSARDPKAATPGVIPTRCANGWMGEPTGEQKTATPDATTRIADMACRKCGLWVVRGEDHECARRADPDHARDALATAKAAIAPPPTDRPVEDVELSEGYTAGIHSGGATNSARLAQDGTEWPVPTQTPGNENERSEGEM